MENTAKYLIALISFAGVGVIFYSFAGVFTQKKLYRWLITILLALLCVFFYWLANKPSKVVQMKEDILYVKPKAKH